MNFAKYQSFFYLRYTNITGTSPTLVRHHLQPKTERSNDHTRINIVDK